MLVDIHPAVGRPFSINTDHIVQVVRVSSWQCYIRVIGNMEFDIDMPYDDLMRHLKNGGAAPYYRCKMRRKSTATNRV